MPWFALQILGHFERKIQAALASPVRKYIRTTGEWELISEPIEEFTPFCKVRQHRLSPEKPLFPGYCFVRLTSPSVEAIRHAPEVEAISRIPGVIRILGYDPQNPQPIPDEEIESIRSLLASGFHISSEERIPTVGEEVIVNCGPLIGQTGIMVRTKGQARLIIRVSLLNRGMSVEIDRKWVAPVRTPAKRAA